MLGSSGGLDALDGASRLCLVGYACIIRFVDRSFHQLVGHEVSDFC